MQELFEGLSTIEQAYWTVALVGSGVFVIIFAITFIGGGDTDMAADGTDFEADDGGVGFQFFTFKNLVAFITVFGWTGVLCTQNGLGNFATLGFSTLAGLVMMVLTSLLFYQMHKLAHSGTLKIKNAIGAVGEVYLPIGANRSNIGKIQIRVQGSLRELDAVTDSQDDLPTSTIVKVTEIVSAELLLVEKLKSN
jgi:hypothetical protein